MAPQSENFWKTRSRAPPRDQINWPITVLESVDSQLSFEGSHDPRLRNFFYSIQKNSLSIEFETFKISENWSILGPWLVNRSQNWLTAKLRHSASSHVTTFLILYHAYAFWSIFQNFTPQNAHRSSTITFTWDQVRPNWFVFLKIHQKNCALAEIDFSISILELRYGPSK